MLGYITENIYREKNNDKILMACMVIHYLKYKIEIFGSFDGKMTIATGCIQVLPSSL